jgi:hypothetical protein
MKIFIGNETVGRPAKLVGMPSVEEWPIITVVIGLMNIGISRRNCGKQIFISNETIGSPAKRVIMQSVEE